MARKYDLGAPLEDLLAAARRDFGNVTFEPVTIGGATLEMLQIADMPAYIEKLVGKARPGSHVELPLWAKIWPACTILTMFVNSFPFRQGATFLEVGAGCGLTGLALAARGHQVTLSDKDPGALLFSRINTLKNGLEDRAETVRVDFTKESLDARFDHVVGCELFYRENLLAPLVGFIQAHLEPDGEAVLASDAKREGRIFFELAGEHFKLMKKDVPYKDCDTGEAKLASLYRLGGQG